MQKKGYRTNICIKKAAFALSLALFLGACAGKGKGQSSNYEECCLFPFFSPPFVAMDMACNDTVYKVVMGEADLYLLTDEKRRSVLFPLFRNDTIRVGDGIFRKLRERCQFVVPQARIDSICRANEGKLMETFFKHDVWRNWWLNFPLSPEEQDYLIYVLFRHRIYVMPDFESGNLLLMYPDPEQPKAGA